MLKLTMIKILKKQGWLVVAAALIIVLSACTKEDMVNGAQAQTDAAQIINVTVGAGFDTNASTRSAVVYNESDKTRTLIFTKGDKLFFTGTLGEEQQDGDYSYYKYKVAGFLTMVEGSLSEDGKSAKFTGDLYLLTPKKVEEEYYTYYTYEKNANATYNFGGKDPISLTTSNEVYLVHEDAVKDKDYQAGDEYFYYSSDWAADVNTLMTTKMSVGCRDGYNAEKKSFKLTHMGGPVLNCNIDGLTANTTYQMSYVWSPFEGTEWATPYDSPIKADASGKATFAIFAFSPSPLTNTIKFTPLKSNGEVDEEGEVMLVDLGPQNLDYNKVYNITRTAYPEGYMVDVEIEATSPSTVSSAIQTTLNTANATFPVNFILKNTVTTGADNTDITIPTQNGAGRSIDVCLTFKKMPSDAAGTLAIKTDRAGESTTTATNKLSVVLPESETGINLNIDAPTSTVSLKSASGRATKFKEVVARTAFNTLVVDDDVTVGNAEIKDGVVQINNEGILESWSFGAKSNGDQVSILEDGGIEPLMIPRTDEYGITKDVYQITRANGEPYYAHSLKIVKDEADYSIVWFRNASHEAIPLKTVVVGDGATLQTNYIAMENIVGEGTAQIKYRRTGLPDFTDDTQYNGLKFYEYNSDMSGVKTVKDITFAQPEIATDEYFINELNAKIAEGYRMHEPRLNMDVESEISGCTFLYNHVFFCPEITKTCPYVKNCKFVHVNHELDVIPIENDLVEFRVPCYPPEESNGITFEGCEFSEGTKFWGYFSRHDPDNQNPISFPNDDNIHFTGYVNFVNCKMGGVDFTGANTDFVKNFSAITGTHFIIKFNGVPKYEVIPQWDSENNRNVIRPIAE